MSQVTDFINNRANYIGQLRPAKWYCSCGEENHLQGLKKTDVCKCGKDKHDFRSYYKIYGNQAITCMPKVEALEAVRFARKEERFIMADTGMLGIDAQNQQYNRSYDEAINKQTRRVKIMIFNFMTSGLFYEYYRKIKNQEDVPIMLSRFLEKHFAKEGTK